MSRAKPKTEILYEDLSEGEFVFQLPEGTTEEDQKAFEDAIKHAEDTKSNLYLDPSVRVIDRRAPVEPEKPKNEVSVAQPEPEPVVEETKEEVKAEEKPVEAPAPAPAQNPVPPQPVQQPPQGYYQQPPNAYYVQPQGYQQATQQYQYNPFVGQGYVAQQPQPQAYQPQPIQPVQQPPQSAPPQQEQAQQPPVQPQDPNAQ